MAARAVVQGGMAAILPSLAAPDLAAAGAREVRVGLLRDLQREICLASNPRLARIRPIVNKAAAVLVQTCRF